MEDIHYNPAELEPRIYKKWLDLRLFSAAYDREGGIVDPKRAQAKPYVIVIPPPNVTGRLHMGHALNNTFQDILIRYKRMDGFDALWVPGTDHAGIATQTVVKKMLDEQGIDYRTLGRDEFVKRVWTWKEKFGDIILQQLKHIGCSCDWGRTRFTMDENLSRAVTKTFVSLSEQGLIYRGKRIVNWCPVDRTALSDDEVETKEGGEPGFLWHIKYPLQDGSDGLVVATTRPETLFGDVAVAVNPKDKRYARFVGKNVIVPLQGRIVPVIADEYVDMTFGTGCLKITPAHDPNDFEIGARHNLEPINVMEDDATMNSVVPEKFRGLDRFKCRHLAVEELKKAGLLVSEEERLTPLGRSYRSKEIIEYRLSDQWFVRMKPLAEKVLRLHADLNIQPPQWEKVYLDWLARIRDWCVSRQIWWGHRIPAWYCEKDKNCPPIVSEHEPEKCSHCGAAHLKQDDDVLDTWFSSALWPMSVFGWPEKTKDFERYFPTTTLLTGKDIIYFWVARMNMLAAHFENKLPYKNVFIHPIVLDERGETMSKSKGNGIDPLVVVDGATLTELETPVREARPTNMKEILKRIEKNFPQGYEAVGADALRYTLVYLASGGQQMKLSLTAFHELGRRFLTKLSNSARFIFMYVDQEGAKGGDVPQDFSQHRAVEDIWMQARIQLAANKIRESFDGNDFASLGQVYYQLVWNDFCDWYIELTKVRLMSAEALPRKTALHNLAVAFDKLLVLLHPIIPFVTEDLWEKLLQKVDAQNLWGALRPNSDTLMVADFIKGRTIRPEEGSIIAEFARLQGYVTAIRSLRKTYRIKEAEKISASVFPSNAMAKNIFKNHAATLSRLCHLANISVLKSMASKPEKTITLLEEGCEIYLDLVQFIDVSSEKTRLQNEIENLERQATSLNTRLQNEEFLQNAKADVVALQQQQLENCRHKLDQLHLLLQEISAWE